MQFLPTDPRYYSMLVEVNTVSQNDDRLSDKMQASGVFQPLFFLSIRFFDIF